MSKKRKRPTRPNRGGTNRQQNHRNRDKSFSISPSKVAQKEYLKDEIRLNKYIAHAGFCSRRDADEFISAGKVKVNGKTVTELGVKVSPGDSVTVDGQSVSLEPFVYILLNKGKDTISTTDDEKDRNTVLDVVSEATGQRVYPVGRLDRDTMGLLILTNDGDLAHRLMHPSYSVKKTYEITTNKLISDEQLEEYRQGITLEDGPVKPASVKRSAMNPFVITISVYEGRNHLIRRMVRFMNAEVVKLKRVRYAGLNEKNLRVGRWRYLKQKEINDLRKLVSLEALNFNKD
jgi:23S rRNA pseudouridine2605 synthase